MVSGSVAVIVVVVAWFWTGGECSSCQGWNSTSASNSSLRVFRAPTSKPPIEGRPLIINHLNKEDDYGYIGSQCIPGFNLPDEGQTSNMEWRVVCKKPSELYVILMALNMSESGTDYLQMRRRAMKGVSRRFEAFNLKLNSVVFGHVRGNGTTSPASNHTDSEQLSSEGQPGFRLAYFCVGKLSGTGIIAKQILLNRKVLDYLAVEPRGIDAVDLFLREPATAYTSKDEVVSHIRDLIV